MLKSSDSSSFGADLFSGKLFKFNQRDMCDKVVQSTQNVYLGYF